MAMKETKPLAKKSPATGAVRTSKHPKTPNQASGGVGGAKAVAGAVKPGRRQSLVKDASGVVRTYIVGTSRGGRAAAPIPSPARLVEMINAGFPVQELLDLQATLSLPMERLAPMLGISKATIHRHKAGQVLNPAVSDRVVRFARLMSQAIEVFETEERARQWLSSPQVGLGGAIPLDYARTEVGAREVEYLLGRIEYGVYS